MDSRFRRLSQMDRTFLTVEEPGFPEHIAGLCVVEAAPLLGHGGRLDLEAIRRRLDRRLVRAPELRRMVHRGRLFCGPPIWVDDVNFSIDQHVQARAIAEPGDEMALLETAELLLRQPLARARPLWELWFLTGLADGRLGLLFKIHHAVADGLAAVALVSSFFDLDPYAPDPPEVAWSPEPVPSAQALFTDNLRGRLRWLGSSLVRPTGIARSFRSGLVSLAGFLTDLDAAPTTSLNVRSGEGRRIRVVRFDQETAHAAAHAHGAKINDLLLTVVSGGVRELLQRRGEPVQGLELVVGVPATLRTSDAARELGNAAGTLYVRLPVGEADPGRRVELTAAAMSYAKAHQRAADSPAVFNWLAATGLFGTVAQHQRMLNFFVSNVPGPPVPVYVLGARIDEIMPVIAILGNVSLSFVAISYCGGLDLVVNADRQANPDIDVLVAGMQGAWEELATTTSRVIAQAV
jgi:diacylglycerol O-acyltransferase / wax synthase